MTEGMLREHPINMSTVGAVGDLEPWTSCDALSLA